MPRETEFRIGRNWVRQGDVVRVHSKRGLWRFVAYITHDEREPAVELVGPDHDPRTRTLPASVVRRIAQTEVVEGETRTRRSINHVRKTS